MSIKMLVCVYIGNSRGALGTKRFNGATINRNIPLI